LADTFWPGPLSFILPKSKKISSIITAGGDTVAVRMPAHPLSLSLLTHLDFPLVAPSANPSNYISATTAKDVARILPELKLQILDGGECKHGVESTVIGFQENNIILYRAGAISQQQIEAAIGRNVIVPTNKEDILKSPGQLSKHYSPHTTLLYTDDIEQTILALPPGKQIGLLLFMDKQVSKFAKKIILSQHGNLTEAAQHFYQALHQLDSSDLDVIVAELFPNRAVGIALNDKLSRAGIYWQHALPL
jgi:Putative translation factor (SUA5)